MVMVFEANAAVTPEGKPLAVPMPVAPVVVCVISVKAVLIHKVGVLDAAPAVLLAFTTTVPVTGVPLQVAPPDTFCGVTVTV